MSSSRRPPGRPSRDQGRATRSRAPAKRPAAKAVPRQAELKAKPRSRSAAPPPAKATRPPPGRSIRLARSPSRLTIKPGPPQGPRPQLELSTRPRPSGPRRLSDVELDEDEVLIDAFDAMLDGVKVRITAVLERTCVYVGRDGDRRLARRNDLWIEADKLPIRRRGR